ncbi:MAG: hypothetical protein Kow0020_12480 [Wenzhouxiangellaceae bacterium]
MRLRTLKFFYGRIFGIYERKIDRRLAYAIWKEDAEMVRQALDEGANPNAKNIHGEPLAALCLTATRRHCLPLLVDAGLRIDDVSEWTHVLHQAAGEGVPALLAWCIEIGIDVNARDTEGRTALMYAAQFGDEVCCRLLLDAGASPRLKCPEGRTAVDYAKRAGAIENEQIIRAAMKRR